MSAAPPTAVACWRSVRSLHGIPSPRDYMHQQLCQEAARRRLLVDTGRVHVREASMWSPDEPGGRTTILVATAPVLGRYAESAA